MSRSLPFTLRAYGAVASLLAPLAPFFLAMRGRRGKEDSARWGERLGRTQAEPPARPVLWIHGASVGEALTILPLAERLAARSLSVLITTGTVTSAAVVGQRLPAGVLHQYVPLDLPGAVRGFLDHWKPKVAIFAESELWPTMTGEAHRRNIPIVLVNGRMSARSFKRWRLAPFTIRTLLRRFDLCLAQSAADAERFSFLGARHVIIAGNLKFDVPAPPADPVVLAALTTVVKDRPIWIAASTHPGEDRIIARAHAALKQRFPNLLTILVPRHPKRGEMIVQELAGAGLKLLQRSRRYLPDRETDIYVADTIGEMGLFFRLSPIVFVGGSLVPHGGQNPIEAAKLGSAILHGPHIGNFAEAYAALQEAGGARVVLDAASLAQEVAELLTDPAAIERRAKASDEVVKRLSGALDKTMASLEPYLMQIALER